ncbi:MAG: hypothetical protein H6807_17460 [Planctomycetes bacterium]|nr:hypothetical protein [Planctomycetota bacterium]
MHEIARFPAESYLRIYHAPRQLEPDEQARIERDLAEFLGRWSSHEAPVTGGFEVVHGRFVVVAADESRVALSGCAKDDLTGLMRGLGGELGVDLVHAPPICFREGDGIRSVSRADFGELAEQGLVNAGTKVFDLTLATVGAYRQGRFELPAGDCWHARAYDLARV